MCFSAEADFTASALIGAVGVATLLQVKSPRAALFAGLPLFFAAHQFTEGFVWLGLGGRLGADATHRAIFLFMLCAQAVLPLLASTAVLLIEPPGRRRTAITALTVFGGCLAIWVAHGLLVAPNTAVVERSCIAFRNPVTNHPWVMLLYALPTCGAPMLSTHPRVRAFGAVMLAGMIAVLAVKAYALTSVWCLYAAVASVMIYRQFRARGSGLTAIGDGATLRSSLMRAWGR